MGISGAWKTKQQVAYSGALRQGTGWNAVHAVRDTGTGRDLSPGYPDGTDTLNDDVTNDNPYGYSTEDHTSVLWGYGTETGTADRPGLGTEDNRASTDGYPPYNRNGSRIRAELHGPDASSTAKTTQPDAWQGYGAKVEIFGGIEDAQPSDPAQYERQTSMTQMPMNRTGSQRGAGSDSEYNALVPGTRPTMGQRSYRPSMGGRLAEMLPRQQDLIIRPFSYRTAGTPDPDLMTPNEMYLSEPLQRTPNSDPYQGPTVPVTDVAGFMDEGWNI